MQARGLLQPFRPVETQGHVKARNNSCHTRAALTALQKIGISAAWLAMTAGDVGKKIGGKYVQATSASSPTPARTMDPSLAKLGTQVLFEVLKHCSLSLRKQTCNDCYYLHPHVKYQHAGHLAIYSQAPI